MTITIYPVPTQPEVREKLAIAGWVIKEEYQHPTTEVWQKLDTYVTLTNHTPPIIGTDTTVFLGDLLEFAAILGIQSTPPTGMVLIDRVAFDAHRRHIEWISKTAAVKEACSRVGQVPNQTDAWQGVKLAANTVLDSMDSCAALAGDNQKGAPSQESEAK